MKTLKEYILDLQKLVEENPKTADFIVITAKDAEGNGYEPIYYGPTIGLYDVEEDDNNFISEDQYHEYDGLYEDSSSNAVCVN